MQRGSTSRARDILSRQSELETERGQYEAVWEQVAEFCDPDAPDVWGRRAVLAGRACGKAASDLSRCRVSTGAATRRSYCIQAKNVRETGCAWDEARLSPHLGGEEMPAGR
jgi:hypothetical protein